MIAVLFFGWEGRLRRISYGFGGQCNRRSPLRLVSGGFLSSRRQPV